MKPAIGRRQALTALGGAGLGILAACSGDDDEGAPPTSGTTQAPSTAAEPPTTAGAGGDLVAQFDAANTCAVTPEATAGPYYLDLDLVRSDIREDRDGTPLHLGVRVLAADCQPIPDAVVDVWHCDGLGLYSGYEAASEGGPGGGATDNETYLRGTQVTDAAGIVQFTTIYPGWYRGRTIHIHATVRLDNRDALTTQFYFDESVTEAVYQQTPYAADTGRDAFNDNDGLFLPATLLTLTPTAEGYQALINVSVAPQT